MIFDRSAGRFWRKIVPAMLIGLAATGCSSSRQTTYSGPMIPIVTQPLTARMPVQVLPANNCQPGCPCVLPRFRGRRIVHPIHRYRGAPPQYFSYPHVIDDPSKPGYQPNSKWDIGRKPPEPNKPGPQPSKNAGSSVGKWRVVGAPAGCSVRLSSQGLLDLKRASASGCGDAPIAKVTGWKQRGKGVDLYIAGQGSPTALEPSDSGALKGGNIELSRGLARPGW